MCRKSISALMQAKCICVRMEQERNPLATVVFRPFGHSYANSFNIRVSSAATDVPCLCSAYGSTPTSIANVLPSFSVAV